MVVFLRVHTYPLVVLAYTFVPNVDHDRFHGRTTSDFNRLVSVHSGMGSFTWSMVTEARSVLDVKAEKWSEVIKIAANYT